MGIFNKIGGVASDVSKNVNEKTKTMSDASNLKRKVLYEEERIMEIFSDIGKTYYKTGVLLSQGETPDYHRR